LRANPVKTYEAHAWFEAAPDGSRFVLIHRPAAAAVRGTVILAWPLAEEMNKCRRMISETARALATDGWQAVQVDLYGCGDSDGDFDDATWTHWVRDLERAVQTHAAGDELWLWGVRAGALLLAPLLTLRPDANVLLWQPMTDGAVTLDQFLWLRAATAVVGGDKRDDRKALRERLARGESVEVAGYVLSPSLAEGLGSARLAPPPNFAGRVVWIEVVANVGGAPRAAAIQTVDAWRKSGHTVDFSTVVGAPFWQTVEIVEVPELIAATRRALAVAKAPHFATLRGAHG
jgi:exosortase A-associated hydrolase 2